jgi:hypothetical protein
MNNRTVGIVATVLSALVCGCASIFACIWGVISLTGAPINVTSNGEQSVQTLPPAVGAALLCLAVLLVAIPVIVGFVTLRKKPEAAAPVNNDPLPPAS